jgi:hypothetical protein
VVLPAPDGPTSATTSPGATASRSRAAPVIAPRRVREVDLLEASAPPPGGSGTGTAGSRIVRDGVDDRVQPLGGAGGALQRAPQARQLGQRAGDDERVEEERRQLAGVISPRIIARPPSHTTTAIAT